jgi:hypothetical protein
MPGLMLGPRDGGEICRSEASLKRNRQLPFERNVDELLNALKNEVAVDIYATNRSRSASLIWAPLPPAFPPSRRQAPT